MMTGPKKTFGTFLEKKLNPQQKKAVSHDQGAILVIAGAGSGKTRIITARIAHLIIERNVDPSAIIALTFTNKAAREMQERIAQFLENKSRLPFVGTFHSYCLQLLKHNQHLLETPFFSILDEEDQQKILKNIIQRNNLKKEVNAKNLSYQISWLKNHTIDTDSTELTYQENPLLKELYNSYEHIKKLSKSLDFDDLLLETNKLFTNNKTFKKQMQTRVRHILVDEYQDTNLVQHALLKHMAKNNRNSFSIDSLCVVGDEDQSIYSWRGATIANILNFKKDFPKAITIKIEQNYRSVQPILDVANHIIKHNKKRNPKKLWSKKKQRTAFVKSPAHRNTKRVKLSHITFKVRLKIKFVPISMPFYIEHIINHVLLRRQ